GGGAWPFAAAGGSPPRGGRLVAGARPEALHRARRSPVARWTAGRARERTRATGARGGPHHGAGEGLVARARRAWAPAAPASVAPDAGAGFRARPRAPRGSRRAGRARPHRDRGGLPPGRRRSLR